MNNEVTKTRVVPVTGCSATWRIKRLSKLTIGIQETHGCNDDWLFVLHVSCYLRLQTRNYSRFGHERL